MKITRLQLRQLINEMAAANSSAIPAGMSVFCVNSDLVNRYELQHIKFFIGRTYRDFNFPYANSHVKIVPSSMKSAVGNCNNAWKVLHAKASNNLGPFLYDIAMEWATINGGGLTCDRMSVSDSAYNLWDYYIKNRVSTGEIEIVNHDMMYNPKTPELEDDCRELSSVKHYERLGLEDKMSYDDWWWGMDPLSKAYKKQPVTINSLGERFIEKRGYGI